MRPYYLLLLALVFIASCEPSKEHSEEAEVSEGNDEANGSEYAIATAIASAYGIDEFDSVEVLQYTFNYSRNDTIMVSRNWEWRPRENSYKYSFKNRAGELVEGELTRNEMLQDTATGNIKNTDWAFINDQYWLLFPYHLVWDANVRFEAEEEAELHFADKTLPMLRVIYTDSAGYSPNDIYELFFNEDYLIQEWNFKSGGRDTMNSPITWEDHREFGPFTFSLSHQNPERGTRLYFTNVKITMLNGNRYY